MVHQAVFRACGKRLFLEKDKTVERIDAMQHGRVSCRLKHALGHYRRLWKE
ncbi:hypothetical protein NBRC111894_3975 [Sporolactobacillus inulinus]|uniref:Uncharacterized protein n=1 Tax=Sporolactobacillus inulinus TaxID=2078 RepID=A0A4Y1ZHI3_9BACL|nr:hypothetical protein NBRC111894_3975 [Sporolactobacillus inulinus]